MMVSNHARGCEKCTVYIDSSMLVVIMQVYQLWIVVVLVLI